MRKLRAIFGGTLLATMAAGLAQADTIISFTSPIMVPTLTDQVNGTLVIPAFNPGVNGIPVGAVLNFYTFSVTETISGTINVTNGTPNTFGASAQFGIDTLGAVSIGSPLTGDGQPDGVAGDATNDIFDGLGPDAEIILSVAGLTHGQSTGDVPYTTSKTVTTGDLYDTATTAPPDPIALYYSTYTNQDSKGLGGNGSNVYTEDVSLAVTVNYDYSIPSATPEPVTMAMMGGALIGLGLLGKRFKRRS